MTVAGPIEAAVLCVRRLLGVVLVAGGVCGPAAAGLGLAEGAASRADRAVLTAPILFVKRFNYQGLHIYDTFYQWRPGGGIYVLENPAAPPPEHRVRPVIDPTTAETLGEGIYFDPALSHDASRLLFCFKGSPQGDSVICEIGVDGTGLRRIDAASAPGAPYHGSGGGHHDVKPGYLPDGRIVFTSTRLSGLVPCANNGVAILHVMRPDGSGREAISVNNVTEFDPCVLADGSILFGRWEYIDRNALVIQSLWTVQPDGRNEMEVFANNMVFPEAVLQAKPVPGSDGLVVATFAPHNAPPRGTIAMVDTRLGKNTPEAITNFETPDRPTHDRGESCDPWPLNDRLVLYSGVPPDPDAPTTALETPGFRRRSNPKLNALMLIDRDGRRVVVHSDPAIDLHNPIPLAPRPLPRLAVDLRDRSQRAGRFYVNDVLAAMPTVPRGSVKWLRVVEETSRNSPSPGGTWLNQTFSISAALAWSAKVYHGVVPVEPDGSVYFEAPAGRALYFQLLDHDYRLVRGMRTFIQAVPGTTRSCAGCHEYNPVARGAPRLVNRQPRRLQDESWGSGTMDYPTRVQPILDARCVGCHGGEGGLAAGLDLTAGWTELFNTSYEALTARREKQYVADLIAGVCCMNGTAHWSCQVFPPYAHGSGRAPLADILLREPHRSRLTAPERDTLFAWIDSNGVYFGTWDYTRTGAHAKEAAAARRAVTEAMHAAGCARCHADDKGAITRFDNWINLERPELSLVLRAPLPPAAVGDAGNGYGLGLCRDRRVDSGFSRRGLLYRGGYAHQVRELDSFPTQIWPPWPPPGDPYVVFASTQDPGYRRILSIIEEARLRQLADPRIDMPGADVVGEGIREGSSRLLLPFGLPDPLPGVNAAVDAEGWVRLEWEASARTDGLIAEIHRGSDPDFEPVEATLRKRTARCVFRDLEAPEGAVHYAVVFVAAGAETSGAGQPGGVAAGCPASVHPGWRRSPPVRVTVGVPAPLPTLEVTGLRAEPLPGRVRLRWDGVGPPGVTTYEVYGRRRGSTLAMARLNRRPLHVPAFTDSTGVPEADREYAVVASSPRRIPPPIPPLQGSIAGRPLPPPVAPVLRLGPELEGMRLHGAARFDADGALLIPGNGCMGLSPTPERLVEGPFGFVLDAWLDAPGQMPVLLGCGRWNGAGWFLQSIGGRWRFHLSGVSCDGGAVPVGRWTRLVGSYDGETASLYQDGALVARCEVPQPPEVWSQELLLGQYALPAQPAYQFSGRIRGLSIYQRPLSAEGR